MKKHLEKPEMTGMEAPGAGSPEMLSRLPVRMASGGIAEFARVTPKFSSMGKRGK